MKAADRSNSRIVDRAAVHTCGKCDPCKTVEVTLCLADELKSRAGIQLCERLQSELERCRRFVDLRMSDDRDELMRTRPRYCPPLSSRCELSERSTGLPMKLRVLPMRIYQKVGIDGDHDCLCPSSR